MKEQRAYGLWDSPVTTEMLSGQKRHMDLGWADDGETLVWCEGRGAKNVLVAKYGSHAPRDISGEVGVRGGVGYGGGEFTVFGQSVFFCGQDGRLYRVELGSGEPEAITPAFGKIASPAVSPDGRWVAFVWTDGVDDVLAVVESHGRQWPQKIVVGADFYMQPAWSHDGERLAWISWDQPNMPWDGTRLETAEVSVDSHGLQLGEISVWAGNENIAVQQPSFSGDGRHIAYISDESGFSHIYVRELASGETIRITKGDVEFGGPAWIQGLRGFVWNEESTQIYAVRNELGNMSLIRTSVEAREMELTGASAYHSISQPAISSKGHISFIGSSSQSSERIITLVDATIGRVEARSTNERVLTADLARMKPVSWTTKVDYDQVKIYANYFPPTSRRFESSGKPPAIIMVHGGPTAQRTASYDARNQYFATRGFAVLDVNYRGSTGYGREYQDALYGNWGLYDVQDAIAGAQYLVDNDLADPDRLVIMGGSAGGYSVLQALTDHPGAFKAGVCLYGIGDVFALNDGTHKFEAAYNDKLLGPLPESAEIWRERSPLNKADNVKDALAIYHGAQDKVVPLEQAERMVKSLKARNIPHYYHVYENEGHGWRRPENITHFYESLMHFFNEQLLS